MTTKLDLLVGYLSGRQGKAIESIRRELDDPSSESSRWLLAMGRRSREIVPSAAHAVDPPVAPATTTAAISKPRAWKRLLLIASGVAASALLVLAAGLAWSEHHARLHRLESLLASREVRWARRFDRLDEVLSHRPEAPPAAAPAKAARNAAPPAPATPARPQARPQSTFDSPTILALAAIETKLGELQERLGQAPVSPQQSDPAMDDLRRDVAQLRRELESSLQVSRQENRQLGMAIQEMGQFLRGLAMRLWGQGQGQGQGQVPVPVPMPQVFPQHHRPGGQAGAALVPGLQFPNQLPVPEQNVPRADAGQFGQQPVTPGTGGPGFSPRMLRPVLRADRGRSSARALRALVHHCPRRAPGVSAVPGLASA